MRTTERTKNVLTYVRNYVSSKYVDSLWRGLGLYVRNLRMYVRVLETTSSIPVYTTFVLHTRMCGAHTNLQL